MSPWDRKEYDKMWRKKNKEKCRAASFKYRTRHRERILAERRAQYATSSERRDYNAAWRRVNKERARATRKKWAENNRLSSLVSFAKCRARRLNVPFNITKHDLTMPKRCPVFGFKLSTKVTKGDLRAASIDRIVPKRGYVRGNVAVISVRANLLKNNATLKELHALVTWMRKVMRSARKN